MKKFKSLQIDPNDFGKIVQEQKEKMWVLQEVVSCNNFLVILFSREYNRMARWLDCSHCWKPAPVILQAHTLKEEKDEIRRLRESLITSEQKADFGFSLIEPFEGRHILFSTKASIPGTETVIITCSISTVLGVGTSDVDLNYEGKNEVCVEDCCFEATNDIDKECLLDYYRIYGIPWKEEYWFPILR